ncbi:MAG TPA: bifunctional precorrin-2 dehydrogenase/sirohydrochlorin ferrochelatase [Syntrophales bacterium]|nr:bifunctional precorrin-2 dehydrogenase/sirohydrochlorin ferrochelatase [Syntrophales bacterium]
MRYYPICLDITNKRCIVVGGGEVAERKVERLLDFGARVAVIGKKLTPRLKTMKKEGRIDHIDADYDKAYIKDAFLVIGATDRDDVNAKISQDGREKGIPVNIVDDPDKCDFILPSLLQQGDLLIAISTGGKSPALAKKLREDLEKLYGPEYQTLLKVMGSLRKKLVMEGHPSDENKPLFEAVIHSDILQHIKDKKWEQVKKIIYDITGADIEVGK